MGHALFVSEGCSESRPAMGQCGDVGIREDCKTQFFHILTGVLVLSNGSYCFKMCACPWYTITPLEGRRCTGALLFCLSEITPPPLSLPCQD
jgi:hypothetical protein